MIKTLAALTAALSLTIATHVQAYTHGFGFQYDDCYGAGFIFPSCGGFIFSWDGHLDGTIYSGGFTSRGFIYTKNYSYDPYDFWMHTDAIDKFIHVDPHRIVLPLGPAWHEPKPAETEYPGAIPD